MGGAAETIVPAAPLSPLRAQRALGAEWRAVVANQRMLIYGVGAVIVIILLILFTR